MEFAVEADYVRHGTCRLSIARHEFFKVNFAFALPKGSRLKPILDKKSFHSLIERKVISCCNYRIMQMMETGLAVYWKRLYWPPSAGKCSVVGANRQSDGPKGLRLVDLQGAFFVLVVGFVLSLFIFFAELAFGSAAAASRSNEQQ